MIRRRPGMRAVRGMEASGRRAGRAARMVLGGFGLALLAILNVSAVPQADPSEMPTEFPRPRMHAYLSHEALPAGASGTLLLTLEVAPNFHIQINDFLEVLLPEGAPITLGKWTATRQDVHSGVPILHKKTAIYLPFTVAAGTAPGPVSITGRFAFQGCIEEPVFACFPPDEMEFPIQFEALPAGGQARPANQAVFTANGVAITPASGESAGSQATESGSAPATQGGPTPDTESGVLPTDATPSQTTPSQEDASSTTPASRSSNGAQGAAEGAGVVSAGQDSGPSSARPSAEGETTGASAQPKRDLASRVNDALAKKSFLAFLLVFIGGILTSFTPCVYPMIPITISYVGGRAKNRAHGFILSLFFVLGIAIMYSALGILAASTSFIFGAAMQSPIVLLVVAGIFAAMGASMLGAFDLALPSGLQGRLTSGAQRGGVIGAILMGMVTGLVASPCVGPVLVVLLTFVAQSGSVFLGFWLLFTFACGLGLLFLVLGTFAGAIQALPGAGSWMDTVKHVFGVLLIGVAIYYLRTLIGPKATGLIAGAYLLIVGVFTGAFTPLPSAPAKGQLFRKSLGLLIFLAGSALFLLWFASLIGAPSLVANSTPSTVSSSNAQVAAPAKPAIRWIRNDETALERARAEGRPVMQDFYAEVWCAACKEMEEKTWIHPEVIAESQRFTAVKMDFTRRDEFSKRATERYEIRGVPTIIFYDSSGKEATRFFGFKDAKEVLSIMRSVH
ncbi:MAG: thioredoxin family protein [Candidatus Eisenbacteria bacterium]|nr:thioredoxin family protein [Candidatus Eisenbacteria bacterium]